MMVAKLNVGQRAAYDKIMAAINDTASPHPRQFFLDGPGGTGKTFLYNTLINVLRGQGKKVISVASTGRASTLLIDGGTYHSQFKIYPTITKKTRSKIEENSYAAKLTKEADLIIVDEETMMTNHALFAIKCLFEKVEKNKNPYANKVLLHGGDFRQCLPVLKHGNRVKVVETIIMNCSTWLRFRQLRLVENMRTAEGSQEYADWPIQLGNGTLPTPTNLCLDTIQIPSDFFISKEFEESLPVTKEDPKTNALIHHVFGDPENLLKENVAKEISNRAILCPKNDDCLNINNIIIKNMPGEQSTYRSIDTVTGDEEEIANFPTEFLNTLKISGIPPHILKLKIGAIIILLKNIDSRRGLCNRTILIVKQLLDEMSKSRLHRRH